MAKGQMMYERVLIDKKAQYLCEKNLREYLESSWSRHHFTYKSCDFVFCLEIAN